MEDWQAYKQGYFTSLEDLSRSNWPNLPACKNRKDLSFYAVDVDGETVAQCDNSASAVRTARHYAGQAVEIRFVHLEEEDFCKDDIRHKSLIHWPQEGINH